jgi:glycosyltransferase involved in cell wall biosynthesis
LNVGGPARQTLLLSRRLHSEFPTTLAAGTATETEGELHDPEVAVHRVPLVRELRPDVDVRAWRAVRSLIVETRADILHTHMAKAGTIGRSAARSLRYRPHTVHTFHGHVLDGYFSAPAQRFFVEVERQLARSTDVLVAVSTEVRDSLLDLGIGRPRQYRVIPLGFDLGSFLAVQQPTGALRRRLGLAADVPLVGVLGRLVPIKDHATLFGAMVLLPGAHLAVIGDGESRQSLEATTKELGLAGRVHFTGWWQDVASAMSDVDVVALTSRNEGTPVSLIEAAACARAAVATRVGGVPSVVRDGVTGLLARAGDIEHVAALLGQLLASPETRRAMGEAARVHVRDTFDEVRLVQETRNLYLDLGRRRSRPRQGA